MLYFFRRYQKIIFICTTVTVVASFAFFGTYRSFAPTAKRKEEKVLYTTLRNRKISEEYLEKMVHFLELEPTFSYDARKILDANPLNDGVISKDFLIQEFVDLLLLEEGKSSLEKKWAMEKSFKPYVHPLKEGLSAQATWQLYAPELWQQYLGLQQAKGALTKEGLLARAMLYLTHQRFNGEMLRQILRYQEYQIAGTNDPLLENKDLSLFGYRNLSDWFGKECITTAAKVIIHGAELAKVQGLKVAKEEVYSDLQSRALSCYEQLQKREKLPVQKGVEWMQLLVNRLQMEEKDVVQIWEDVLYFRRLLDERSASVLTDSFSLGQFSHFANSALTLKITKMPHEYVLNSLEDLQGFELYMDCVGEKKGHPLALPQAYKSSESIALKAPELLGRRYELRLAHVKKEEMHSKVPLAQLWAWQESHYAELQDSFALPSYAEFEQLDETLRKRVDLYSYGRIIDSHPEWMVEALAEKQGEERTVFIRFAQEKMALKGIEDLATLRRRLDQEDSISCYSQDGENFYSFTVKQRGAVGEILSYKEAKSLGAISELQLRLGGEKQAKQILAAIEADLKTRGIDLPAEDKEQFCLEHRFYRYLTQYQADSFYKEGMDDSYKPVTIYKTISRTDPHYQKASHLSHEAHLFAYGKEEGLFFYKIDSQENSHQLSLEKLLFLQQMASRDERRGLIKEIVEAL